MVSNLIRYINEFWFMRNSLSDINKDQREISDRIRKDTNNININVQELFDKIKYFDNIKDTIKLK